MRDFRQHIPPPENVPRTAWDGLVLEIVVVYFKFNFNWVLRVFIC